MPKDKKPTVLLDPEDNGLVLDYFYYVDTEEFSYRSTSLNRAMRLWAVNSADTSEVVNVGRLG